MKKIKLNKKQNYAYSLMTQNKNIFITGPGGVGKSALIKIFCQNYSSIKKIAITSTTGTSALLLNGTTFHSYLGIGLGNSSVDKMVFEISRKKWLTKRWTELQCLIIDEISMMDPDLFDKLEEVARKIRKNNIIFGGIQLILSGDFCQLPVVNSDKFCFESKSWNKCIEYTIYLTEIIRQKENQFQELLNNIRLGIISDEIKLILNKCIGKKLENNYGIKPTKLYSTNIDVDKINNIELDKLALEGKDFYEYNIEIYVYSKVKNSDNIVNKFKKFCNAPDNLQICIGTQIMLLKNLDLSNGLANGSRGVIINFIDDLPLVKFLNGVEKIIDFHIWEIEENDKPIIKARQIPIKVAYALSIHKSQGCSLDLAEIDLSKIFEYGQSYVALSRIKNLAGLSILNINYDTIKAHPKAVEYYKDIEIKMNF